MMLKKWINYILEIFQPLQKLIYSVMIFMVIQLSFQAVNDQQSFLITQDSIPAIITLLLVFLYWRVVDEFKDYETDKKYFPQRPVPSGRISLNDLKILLWLTALMQIIINSVWYIVIVPFAVLFMFNYIMGKWFFLEKIFANNRVLAFLSQSPISLILHYYIIAVYCSRFDINLFTWDSFLVAATFSFVGFNWEIARKTRAPEEEEEGYQTYSQMLGYKGSALTVICFTIIPSILMIIFSDFFKFSLPFVIFITIIGFILIVIFLLFMFRPKRFSPFLKGASEIYSLLLFCSIIFYYIFNFGIRWEMT